MVYIVVVYLLNGMTAIWIERHMMPFEKLFTIIGSTASLRFQLPVERPLLPQKYSF